MWIYKDPEVLKNYSCKASLKKEKECLIREYLHIINDKMPELPNLKLRPVFQEGRWYTGISSHPLLSMTAHGVDLEQSSEFFCLVIPMQFAHELKAEVLGMPEFKHAADDSSDYIAEEQPYTYLYNFQINKKSVLSIDTAGFTPLKYIPYRPAQFFAWRTDGNCISQNIETKDLDSYPEVLNGYIDKARAGEITRLLLKCPMGNLLQCDFGQDGYDVYFDPRTSQSGYIYKYLPEEGRERDWEQLYEILLYFLRFYKKQRGTKWKHIQKEMALDNIYHTDGGLLIYKE